MYLSKSRVPTVYKTGLQNFHKWSCISSLYFHPIKERVKGIFTGGGETLVGRPTRLRKRPTLTRLVKATRSKPFKVPAMFKTRLSRSNYRDTGLFARLLEFHGRKVATSRGGALKYRLIPTNRSSTESRVWIWTRKRKGRASKPGKDGSR